MNGEKKKWRKENMSWKIKDENKKKYTRTQKKSRVTAPKHIHKSALSRSSAPCIFFSFMSITFVMIFFPFFSTTAAIAKTHIH